MSLKTGATDPAERIHDPIHRTSYTFRPDGEDLWVEVWFQDGAHLPEHYHPTLTEYWEVIDGTAELRLNGRSRPLTPDDGPVLVAPNDRHELRNISGHHVHARAKVVPAGRLQEFLTESAWAAREGLYGARNLPSSLRGARWLANFALRFADETIATSPPRAVQRVVLPVVARLLGAPDQTGPLR